MQRVEVTRDPRRHSVRNDKAPAAVATGALPDVLQRGENQNPLTFNRPPVTVLPASDAVGTALLRIADLIAAADEPG